MITEPRLRKFLERRFYLLLIIPLFFVAYPLKDPGIAISSDYPFLDTSDTAIHRLWMWNEKGSTDNFELAPRFPIIGIWYLLSFAYLSSELASKIMVLFGFILSSASFYFSFLLFFRNKFTYLSIELKISAIVSSLFFTYNAWTFNRIHHWYLWIAYAILPLFFVSIFYSFKNPNKWNYIVCSALIWSVASTTPHMVIFYGIVVVGTFLGFIINNLSKRKPLAKLVVSLVMIFLIYVSVNMYWVYPYMVSFSSQVLSPNYEVTKENIDLLSRETNLLNAIRIIGYWINSNIFETVEHSSIYLPWLISSFIIPIVAFSALLLKKSKKFIIILSSVALIGIFLSMGVQSPFDYYNLVSALPLFSSFVWLLRDPDKWSFFIASSFSLLIGFVCYNVLLKSTSPKIREPRRILLASLFIILIVGSICLSAYPFYDDRMDALKPVLVPSEFDNLNRYLSTIDTDKVVFMPYPLKETDWHQDGPVQSIYHAHSIKPSIEGTEYNLAASNFYNFLESSVIENRSKNIANLAHALGSSYVIFHNDTWSRGAGTYDKTNSYLLERLLNLNDIKNIENIGFYNIFKTNNSQNSSAGEVNIPSDNTLIVGGLDTFESLNTLVSFDTLNSSIIFLDNNPPKKMGLPWQSNDRILLDGQASYYDLALSFTDDKYFIAPIFESIHYDPAFVWSKSGTNDPINIEFHPLLKNLGIFNWDFDYTKGLVVTKSMGANLSVPFDFQYLDQKSKSGDSFQLFMRFLKNQKGGAINIYYDGKMIKQVDTYDKISNSFVWERISSLNSTEGKHTISLENVAGFNAVNILAVISAEEMDRLSDKANQLIANNTQIVHLMEAESNFHNGKGKQSSSFEYLSNQNLNSTSQTIQGQFNVPINSDLANIQFNVSSNGNSISPSPFKELKISPSKNTQNFFAVEFERNNISTSLGSLRQIDWLNYDKQFISSSLETENPLNGNSSLKVKLSPSNREGWNILSTDFIPINDNRFYSASLNISAKDVAQLHSRVLYYDSQRKSIEGAADYIFRGKDGTFTSNFATSILPPLKAEFLKLQVLTLSSNSKLSEYVLDNVKLDEIANPVPVDKDNLFVNTHIANNQSLGELVSNNSGFKIMETEPFDVNPGQTYNYTISTDTTNGESESIMLVFKNSSDVVDDVTTYNNNASQGRVLSLGPKSEISGDLNIIKPANYTIGLRAKTCDTCTYLRVDIFEKDTDGSNNNLMHTYNLTNRDQISGLNWLFTDNDYLKEGKYKINIYSNSSTDLDSVVVYSQDPQNSHSNIDKKYSEKLDLSLSKQQTSKTYLSEYKKINPTKHIVTIKNATEPYFLALAESYDPLWTAYRNNDQNNAIVGNHNDFKINSIPLYGVINGFYINQTGNYDIVLEYEPQQWLTMGAIISIMSMIFIFLGLCFSRSNMFRVFFARVVKRSNEE